MEFGETCQWYLVRVGTEYAVQYYGDDADQNFPPGLDGTYYSYSENWLLIP